MRAEKFSCPHCFKKVVPWLKFDPEAKGYWRRCPICEARLSRVLIPGKPEEKEATQ